MVSQYALEPATYRLEYIAPDGTTGPLKLHAIDVANDLAVVQLDRTALPFFTFDERAVQAATCPKGERLFAMGNPLDLGFTIVEGTYNGLVDKSYNERIHFSGALNPGMSGGPTVTAAAASRASTSPSRSAATSSASWCRRATQRRCSRAPKAAGR